MKSVKKEPTSAVLCRNGPGETISADPRSVRLAAEMRGVNNLPERVCAEAALAATLHLRKVLQDARKFTRRGKRLRTTTADLHRSIKRHDASVRAAGSRGCLLYTSPSPRDLSTSRMPSSA